METRKITAPPTRVHFVPDASAVRLPRTSVVLCDRNVPPSVRRRFPEAVLVRAGEEIKTLSSVGRLAEKVLRRCADRSMTLVAVGGGTVGDAVGFLSSILWRGVGLVHVPTTLLAMVDSAHGGKTAVNLARAKNQLGTFYPARDVWIVRSVLSGMPKALIAEGLVEVIKSVLIGDRDMAERYFRKGPFGVALSSGVRAAIAVKQRVCRKDPFEQHGHREILNFGHTLGHALELTCRLPHGRAVGWGLCAAALVSERFGFNDADAVLAIVAPLLAAPETWPHRRTIVRALSFDKKRRHARLRSVVLCGLAEPVVTTEVTAEDWLDAFSEARRRVVHG